MKKRLVHCQRPLFLTLLVFYIGLVLFSLFNYRSHCTYTSPESLVRTHILNPDKAAHICPINFDNLDVVHLDIFSEPSFDLIKQRYPHVALGGQWKPQGCTSFQKVAIIIPYRNRLHHLKIMLNRIHPLLWKQNIDYQVFLVEQAGNDRFNRGKLMNVGFYEAMKIGNFDCFVFHDVDLLPENDKNLYMCDDHLRQLSSAIDETRYHVMYFNYAGGVIAMKADSFKKINGYPNSYWGWGNEDDDISARTQEAGLLITRPPEHIGMFKMVRHVKETRSENGYDGFLGWRGRWMHDGLTNPITMNYTVKHLTQHPLFTNITADIGPSAGHRIDITKDTTRETFWWFLKFYFP
ncbi:beta-1,4-galactosyltransferase 3-like [Pecten maximus]|uniref:beta-1,4-galactosyltransferase 3-like n=1 Tax=Pecten maximus TaxID=6579 RepID=UPI001457F3BE|nr:beta-1,4-galactosyltransferase 3-like [Pecten maximus]